MAPSRLRNTKTSKMRRAAKIARANAPRKPLRPFITKSAFLKALEGTGGIKAEIAKNAGVARTTIIDLLKRPDWDDMREAFQQETDSVTDEAERTIRKAITQTHDMVTATLNARWYLSKIARVKYGEERKVVVEGGAPERPLQSRTLHEVSIEELDLPVEVQRVLLAAAEKKEREALDKEKLK